MPIISHLPPVGKTWAQGSDCDHTQDTPSMEGIRQRVDPGCPQQRCIYWQMHKATTQVLQIPMPYLYIYIYLIQNLYSNIILLFPQQNVSVDRIHPH